MEHYFIVRARASSSVALDFRSVIVLLKCFILTVQHTFGAIVKREMGIAHEKCESKCNIDASFTTATVCKSESTCSTATTLASSDSVFVTF